MRVLAVTTDTPAEASLGAHSRAVPAWVRGDSWNGLVAPKGTPPEIVELLNKETNAAIRDPKIAARFVDFGAPPLGGSTAEFGKIIRDDTDKWAKVIRSAGIKATSDRTGRSAHSVPIFGRFHDTDEEDRKPEDFERDVDRNGIWPVDTMLRRQRWFHPFW